jgi:hypothetical protein
MIKLMIPARAKINQITKLLSKPTATAISIAFLVPRLSLKW